MRQLISGVVAAVAVMAAAPAMACGYSSCGTPCYSYSPCVQPQYVAPVATYSYGYGYGCGPYHYGYAARPRYWGPRAYGYGYRAYRPYGGAYRYGYAHRHMHAAPYHYGRPLRRYY